MIRISIGTSERQISSISYLDESWINQQINRRKDDGQEICVQVVIEHNSVNMHLSTPACAKSRRGGRSPNQKESIIFDLWKKCGLKQSNFSGGNVVAFFKQLRKILE